MYSGFNVYYGIKVSCSDLEIYNILDFQDDEDYDDMSLEEVREEISNRLDDEGYNMVTAYTQECCFAEDGFIFLAIKIGEYRVQNLDYIGSYECVDSFKNKFSNGLTRIHSYFSKNQCEIESELSRMKENYPFLNNYKNRVYTLANSCICI